MKQFYMFLLCMYVTASPAQDFTSITNDLSNTLTTVTTSDEEVAQTVSGSQPGVLQILIVKTNMKSGKSSEELYEFNAGDIDINTVKTYADKDVIKVQLLVEKKQELIKNTIDRKKIDFQDDFEIYALDINNGRKLVDIFKSLIPLAKEITDKRLSLSNYEEHIAWLEQNVGNVALIERQYNQSIARNPNYPGRLELNIAEVSSKNTKSNAYHFNLANINHYSLVFETKGDVSVVEFETRRKLNTVKTFENGQQGNFDNNVVIYCENVEKARDLQKVLKEAIALSEEKIEKTIPDIAFIESGIKFINKYISTIIINETSYNQSFAGDCVVQFNKLTTDPKKAVEQNFFFNFSDLDKNVVNYSTKGKNIFLELETTESKKFLKLVENGEQQKYTDEFSIELSEVEDAIILEDVFKQIIGICQSKKIELSNSKAELVAQLSSEIGRLTDGKYTYDQSFSTEDNAKFHYKIIEISDKKSTEKIYEGNFKDLNQLSIVFETSSKNVYVKANTNYMEKIIQYYEDGVIKNYQDDFTIQAQNIENARTIVNLLKKIVTLSK